MNVKVAVIVVVALVVAFVLVVFYGNVRDDSAGPDSGDWLAWAKGNSAVGFEDLDGPCVDEESSTLKMTSAQCEIDLPDDDALALCSDDPGAVTATVKGDDYPVQEFGAADFACDAPTRIELFDDHSRLTLTCVTASGCAVRVVPPPDD